MKNVIATIPMTILFVCAMPFKIVLFIVTFVLSGECLVHSPTRINGTDGEIGYSQCQSPGAPPFGVELCLIPPHHVLLLYYTLLRLSTQFG